MSTLYSQSPLDEECHSVDLTIEERDHKNVPVLEAASPLPDVIRCTFGNSPHQRESLFLWQSEYSRTYLVIAQTEHAALDWLADFGVLDGMKVPEDTRKEQIEEHGHVLDSVPLGNAGEPYVLEMYRLREVSFSSITCFRSRLQFSQDGWMHLWANNPHNDRRPYRDAVVQLDDDFDVQEYWMPSIELSEDFLQELTHRRVWSLIHEHC